MSRKRKNKKSKLLKFLILSITIIVGISIIGSVYLYAGISKIGGESKKNKDGIDDKNSANILVLGVDIGTVGSKNKNDPKRTDTIMLIHYDKINEDVEVISIPRDTLVKINGRNHKINAAHALGGVSYAVDAVEKLLNIDIDYYGKVNYEGFREVIDSIGGVDMDINNNMDYDDESQNLHIHFKKGENVHLDGKKAEEFFRWRKNNNGTGLKGDLGRIDNQHVFISKVVEKIKSPMIITRIPSILNTLPKYCETDMSGDEIIKYGYYISKAENINMNTLKGTAKYINRISYFIYSKSKNKELLNKLYNSGSNSTGNSDYKNNLKIEILNGTKKTGLAAKYKRHLLNKGYNNSISVGNGESTKETKILFKESLKESQKEYIKEDLNINEVEDMDDKYRNFDVVILLGEDQ